MGELKLSCLQQEKRLHEENMSCMREKNLHTAFCVRVSDIGTNKCTTTHTIVHGWMCVCVDFPLLPRKARTTAHSHTVEKIISRRHTVVNFSTSRCTYTKIELWSAHACPSRFFTHFPSDSICVMRTYLCIPIHICSSVVVSVVVTKCSYVVSYIPKTRCASMCTLCMVLLCTKHYPKTSKHPYNIPPHIGCLTPIVYIHLDSFALRAIFVSWSN